MPRVAVIGSGGAGKSAFAAELGRRLGVEVIHLDRLYWRPGWVPTPREEWRALQRDLVARPDWIIDGNYGATLDLRLAVADVVVFLDVPPPVAVAGILKRWLRQRGRCVQAPGCPEHFDAEFLRWAWRYRRDSRPRVRAALSEYASTAEIVVVRSRREVREALERVVRVVGYSSSMPMAPSASAGS
jgi:adenylate kinase family enzyme